MKFLICFLDFISVTCHFWNCSVCSVTKANNSTFTHILNSYHVSYILCCTHSIEKQFALGLVYVNNSLRENVFLFTIITEIIMQLSYPPKFSLHSKRFRASWEEKKWRGRGEKETIPFQYFCSLSNFCAITSIGNAGYPKIYITIVSISPGGYYSCPKRIEDNGYAFFWWGSSINGQYLRSPGEPRVDLILYSAQASIGRALIWPNSLRR